MAFPGGGLEFFSGGTGGAGGPGSPPGSAAWCSTMSNTIVSQRATLAALLRDYSSTVAQLDNLRQQTQSGGPSQVFTLQEQINELERLTSQLYREIQALEAQINSNVALYNANCRGESPCPTVDGTNIIYAQEETETVQEGGQFRVITRFTCPVGYTRISPAECNMCQRSGASGGGGGTIINRDVPGIIGEGGGTVGEGGSLDGPRENPVQNLSMIACENFYVLRRNAIMARNMTLVSQIDAEFNRRCVQRGPLERPGPGPTLEQDPCGCGQTYDIGLARCVPFTCPGGVPQVEVDGRCTCPQPTCGEGQTFNPVTNRCEPAPRCGLSESTCQSRFPRQALDRTLCRCVDPQCRRIGDFGREFATGPVSSRFEDNVERVPTQAGIDSAVQFLTTTRNQRIATINEEYKAAIAQVLTQNSNNDSQYGWSCSNYNVDQLAGLCTPWLYIDSSYGVEMSYMLVGEVMVAQLNITNLVSAATGIPPGAWFIGPFGRLCQLIQVPRRNYIPFDPCPTCPPEPPTSGPPPSMPGNPDVIPPPPPGPNGPSFPTPPKQVPMSSGLVYSRVKDVYLNQVEHVTYGLWSDNVGNLTTFHTCSTQYTSSQRSHYVVYDKQCTTPSDCPSPQFDIAYGHDLGSGSRDLLGYDYLTPSNAIYGQYRGLCLDSTIRKFNIDGTDTDSIYVINVRKDRMKDRLDEGNIEINLAHLSGSEYVAGGGTLRTHTGSNVALAGNGAVLRLIDDSKVNPPTVTSAGEVYQIVSGTLETGVYNSTNPHIYGLMYPRLGVIVLDGNKLDLSASFGTVQETEVLGDNAYKLFTAISGAAQYTDASGDVLGFQGRKIEKHYGGHAFITVPADHYNFSNNPTYVTGSEGQIIAPFRGQQKTYITSIGMYNDRKELLVVGKLSKPILKTATDEALFKVQFKYDV